MKNKALNFILLLTFSLLSLFITYIMFVSAVFQLIDDAFYTLIIAGIGITLFLIIKTSDAWDKLWDSN